MIKEAAQKLFESIFDPMDPAGFIGIDESNSEIHVYIHESESTWVGPKPTKFNEFKLIWNFGVGMVCPLRGKPILESPLTFGKK